MNAGIITEKIMQRPVIVLATCLYAVLLLTFITVSYIPLILSCVLIIALLMVIRPVRDHFVFLLCVMLLASVCCFRMIKTQSFDVSEGYYSGDVFVVSSQPRLSGDSTLYVTLSSGAKAVMNVTGWKYYSAGSVLCVEGRIKTPDRATNPGEFDYREYLKKKGVMCVLSSDVIDGDVAPDGGLFFELRRSVFELVTAEMDDDCKGLFAAVCLGDTSLLSKALRRSFSISSCSHLIAVSGSHFAGFMAVVTFAFDSIIPASLRRKLPFKLSLSLFYLFLAFITGFGESVTRACIMCICMVFIRDRLSAMCTSALIMIIADPFAVMSSGFNMSCAATLGIMIFAPRLKDLMPEFAAVALSAHIGLLPFYSAAAVRISPVNTLCQIVGGTIVSLICIIVVPVIVLCLLFGPVFSGPVELLLRILIFIVDKSGSVSFMQVNCGRYSRWIFFGIFALIIVFAMPDCVLRKFLLPCSVLTGGLSAGLFIAELLFPPSLIVVFADVGQGDGCLLMTPEHSILIDGGIYEEGDTISDILDWYGIDKVDVAFVSHWDSDHCGGISYLYANDRISTVYAPSECIFTEEDDLYIPDVAIVSAADSMNVDDIEFDIISPDQMTGDENEDSLVIEVVCGGSRLLFTGDIGFEKESELIMEGFLNDCDVLKVGHHGSRFSTSEAFLEEITPEEAVISCGRGNRYGHPTAETLERLESCGIVIRRTDEEGAIIMEFEK